MQEINKALEEATVVLAEFSQELDAASNIIRKVVAFLRKYSVGSPVNMRVSIMLEQETALEIIWKKQGHWGLFLRIYDSLSYQGNYQEKTFIQAPGKIRIKAVDHLPDFLREVVRVNKI